MKVRCELQPDIRKTLANAKCLKTISLTGKGELLLGEVAKRMGPRLAELEQHFSIVKNLIYLLKSFQTQDHKGMQFNGGAGRYMGQLDRNDNIYARIRYSF